MLNTECLTCKIKNNKNLLLMNINQQNFLFQHPLLLNPRYATGKHWLRVQNFPVGQSFERTTKACVLGYIASSCAALSNFTTMRSKPEPPKMNNATTSFYYSGIIPIPGCLLLFSKLFRYNVHRPIHKWSKNFSSIVVNSV